MERWERRDRKLKRRREAMRVSGMGLKKVLLPLFRKRAEQNQARQQDSGKGEGRNRQPLPDLSMGPIGACDRLQIRSPHAFPLPEGRHLPFVPKGQVFRVR